MASRYRSISRPALSFIKSSMRKPGSPLSPNLPTRPSPSFPRTPRVMRCLQSLQPFHSAVSSARLTSRLGIDSRAGSRSLSQETGLSMPR